MLADLLNAVGSRFDYDIYVGSPMPNCVHTILQLESDPTATYFGSGSSIEKSLIMALLRVVSDKQVAVDNADMEMLKWD